MVSPEMAGKGVSSREQEVLAAPAPNAKKLIAAKKDKVVVILMARHFAHQRPKEIYYSVNRRVIWIHRPRNLSLRPNTGRSNSRPLIKKIPH